MCTLSWSRSAGHLSVWFNRDEQRTRAPARPPELHHIENSPVHFLAPTDPVGGGTWIFVNSAGLAACLTNHYGAEFTSENNPRSRGKLLTSLAGRTRPADFETSLRRELRTHPYAPCHLWCGGVHHSPRLWRWDGRELSETSLNALPLHTTSSYRPQEVLRTRRDTFQRQVAKPERPEDRELETFHHQHDPACPAHSVWMEREDAWTVSLTHIAVTPRKATLSYRGRAEPAASTLTLPLTEEPTVPSS